MIWKLKICLFRFGIRPTFRAEANRLSNCDALIVLSLTEKLTFAGELKPYHPQVEEQRKFDAKFITEGGMIVLPDAPFKRLIYSPIGPVNRDYDDVRNFAEATVRGVSRAMNAGARNVLVYIPGVDEVPPRYAFYDLAILLGVYQILYIPLENREFKVNNKLDSIAFTNFPSSDREKKIYRFADAIECGRAVARDIGGSDPERMCAPKVAHYVEALFKNSAIQVEVISDLKVIEKEFPCLGNWLCLV